MFRKFIAVLLFLCLACAAGIAESAEQTAEDAAVSWIDISDAEQFQSIKDYPSGHFRLTNDIDMSGVDYIPFAFSGELDGKGYAILNLTITQPGVDRFTSIDANKKTYDTVGAALFSVATDASIHDLSILGLGINVTTEENCFCAGIAAAASGTTITNCTVEGRVWLHQSGLNTGVGGMLGYAQANVSNCKTDVELLVADTNTEQTCEEFAGGILACGVASIIDSETDCRLYASVHGYCHNGGLIGMYWRGALGQQKCKITGCTVSFVSNFFEDVQSRRAYNFEYIGEEYSYGMSIKNNTVKNFEVIETKDFSKILYPCTCGAKYTHETVEPTETECGYTVYTCPQCGYSLRSNYTPRTAA